MIGELRITDLGVIAEAALEPAPGFTAVTGETGAGKTMIVTGLGLLLGNRGDKSLVRRAEGETVRSARVEGRFVGFDEATHRRVDELGGTLDPGPDSPELLLARTLSALGRSHAYVGGAQVPIGVLEAVASDLVTIHGQSGQLRLARPEAQRDMLDRFGGPELLAAGREYAETWQHWRRADSDLAELRSVSRERTREIESLRRDLDEIAAVDPKHHEERDLAAEAKRLQSLDDIRRGAGEAAIAVNGDEVDFDTNPGAAALLGVARHALAPVSSADRTINELARRTDDLSYQITELGADLAGYLASLESDPARLEEIAARRAALAGLFRKYGETTDEVLEWAERARTRLDGLVGADDRIGELAAQTARLAARLEGLTERLSTLRARAARDLERSVGAELAGLAMPHARLEVALHPVTPGPHGAEQVEFLFAANPGAPPGPLSRVASGGELSRVRLALEVTVGDRPGRTLVFDEVDAGVGGAVAVEIGRRLARLADHQQVIVVTHLAQVAAFADKHYVVVKSDDGRITTSGVREVAETDRAGELARMMAGIGTSETALAHAAELLDVARRSR